MPNGIFDDSEVFDSVRPLTVKMHSAECIFTVAGYQSYGGTEAEMTALGCASCCLSASVPAP